MTTVNIEFNVKIDKEIYTNTLLKTKEEFLNHFIFSNVASDYDFIANSIKQQKKCKEEQEKYVPYLETLKNIKESLLKTVNYELVGQENNTEEVKIKCQFDYYENSICSIEKTVEVEIFTTNIRRSYFMTKDIVRLARAIFDSREPAKEKEIKEAVKTYKHISDFLNEARAFVIINNKEVQFEKVVLE